MFEPYDLIALPKVELHEHLDGGLRISTILDLAHQAGVRLPATEPGKLLSILSPGPSSLEVYLQAFAVTTSVMQTTSALRRVAEETVEDWHKDGLVYGEVRFAPELHQQLGLSRQAVVEAVLDGLSEGRRRYPVETGLILCSMRHAPASLETVKLVRDYANDGVVGFDLAGAEAPFPPTMHREAFEYCAENLLAATCHAGEVTGPHYIREALLACRALRIGHGTQLIQEWDSETGDRLPEGLARWILDRNIPLEVCLTSNCQTRAVQSLEQHPFRRFFWSGLNVSINTDNRLVSNTTLSRELSLASELGNLDLRQLKTLQRNALLSAFCSAETKKRILQKHFVEDADR